MARLKKTAGDSEITASGGKRKIVKTAKAKASDNNQETPSSGKKEKNTVHSASKGKGKGKKKVATKADDDSEGSEGEDGEDGVKLDWKDPDLTWSLISAITDDPVIKQGLFPSPGANVSTAKGGGKPKTDHQYALAAALFGNHKKYSEEFKLATDAKQKGAWGKRIKNRLQNLVKKTRQHLNAMGETGAGITAEDQINMSEENEFTNKWKIIKAGFPWLWQMKDLISERPNAVPVGLGNNASEIDMTGFVSGYSSDVDWEGSKPDDTEVGEEVDRDDDKEDNDEDSNEADAEDVVVAIPQKRAGKFEKKTAARPGKSNPAQDSKRAKVMDRFAEVANAEELTNQKQLDLKKIRLEGQTHTAVAKIKAQADIQREKLRLKAEARREEKRHDHEFRMAQLQLAQRRASRYQASGTAASSSTGYESSGPSGSLSFNDTIPNQFNFDNFDFEQPIVPDGLDVSTAPKYGGDDLEYSKNFS